MTNVYHNHSVTSIRVTAGVIIGLCLLVFFTYMSGLDNKPVAEDFVRSEAFLELGPDRQFRPLYALPMLALQSFFGCQAETPFPYHMLSLIVHLIATLALFFFTSQLIVRMDLTLATVLIFAFYPRHHETVFWPAGCSHAIMTAFALISLGCYLRAKQHSRRIWLIISVIFSGLSIFSSEAGIVVLLIILAYEIIYCHNQLRLNWRTKKAIFIWQYLPFLLISGLYVIILVIGRGSYSTLLADMVDNNSYRVNFGFNTLRDIGGYLSYAIWPFVPLRSVGVQIKIIMFIITGLSFGVALIWGTRLVRFGIIWIVIASMPYALLVPFGNSDRYFYLISVGFCFSVVGALDQFVQFSRCRFGVTGFKIVFICEVALLILSLTSAVIIIQDRSEEWDEAGTMVEAMLNQIYTEHPTVSSDMTFYFFGLPHQYRQSRFIGVGMPSALRTHYNQPSLKVYTSADPELISAVKQVSFSNQVNEMIKIYVYQDGRLIDYSASYNDLKVRSLLNAYAMLP